MTNQEDLGKNYHRVAVFRTGKRQGWEELKKGNKSVVSGTDRKLCEQCTEAAVGKREYGLIGRLGSQKGIVEDKTLNRSQKEKNKYRILTRIHGI